MDIPAAGYAAALAKARLDEGFAGLIAQWDVDASNAVRYSQKTKPLRNCSRLTAGLDVAVKQTLDH